MRHLTLGLLLLQAGACRRAAEADEALSDTVMSIARSRFVWLFVNLLTAFLASSVLGLFEGELQKMVALAVLAPIVASQGGNAATQTMPGPIVRSMAISGPTPSGNIDTTTTKNSSVLKRSARWRRSRSIAPTLRPIFSSATIRCMATVDLPAPPFSLPQTMMCALRVSAAGPADGVGASITMATLIVHDG
jgi:hypothetical protein